MDRRLSAPASDSRAERPEGPAYLYCAVYEYTARAAPALEQTAQDHREVCIHHRLLGGWMSLQDVTTHVTFCMLVNLYSHDRTPRKLFLCLHRRPDKPLVSRADKP